MDITDTAQVPSEAAPSGLLHDNITGMLKDLEGFVTDAGVQMRLAQTLSHREAQYRSIFENTGAGTIIIEKDTTISMANAGFAAMLGCGKEEIEGKIKWPALIAEAADREKMLRFHELRRTRPNAAPLEYEFKLLDITGQKKDIWLRIDMISGTDRSVASLFDITQLKKTERNLRASEAKLSGLLEAFGGFTYTCTPDLNITFLNKTLQRFIGREGLGRRCHQVIYNQEQPCAWCHRDIALGGETAKQEFLNPVDGRWYYAISSPVFGAGEKVIETQTVLIDIHERKQAELNLKEKEASLKKENLRLRAAIKDRYRFGDIVGKSPAMQKVYELILRAAGTDASVIIYGESGTGKELVARAIHQLSDRSTLRFVPVNCGAIPQNLMESEFFGYKRGAFTGAAQDKPGLFEHADGGTLFLDEIGEIREEMQVKLLRVLEGSGFTPIGGLEVKPTNVRVISATNKNLVQLLDKGVMREDFFYRVHIFPIALPPLRERKEDIPLLAEHFLAKHGRGRGATTLRGHEIEALINHDWPGNVRELENTLQRYINLNSLDFMGFPNRTTDTGAGLPLQYYPVEQSLRSAAQAFEKAYLSSLLNKYQWNRTKVAAVLGIERKTLYLKMKVLGLQG
ncbi:MAG: sigma 54-interacting transcriptional regulator [Desulfobacteraceae bacterium]|nr:sigma 54-interacting transcriptional regulator [Desulfobacteraceae bacterium]